MISRGVKHTNNALKRVGGAAIRGYAGSSSSGSESGSWSGYLLAGGAAAVAVSMLLATPHASCAAADTGSGMQKKNSDSWRQPRRSSKQRGSNVNARTKYGTVDGRGVLMFTHDEVKKMTAEGRIVLAYRGGVYDVSAFTGHPGGVGRLQMAAGGDLEVYWKVYTQHNRGHITQDVMQPYKIGELSEKEMASITKG